MNRCARVLPLLLLTFCPTIMLQAFSQRAESPSTVRYQTARVVDVQRRVQRDPRLWAHDIPVTFTEVETYRMRLRLDAKTYITDYTPDVQPGYFPTGWVAGSQVEVRREGRKMFLKAPGGELQARIVKEEK